MIKMKLKDVLEKFPKETKVRVSYANQKETHETTLAKLRKRKILAMTILFPEKKVKIFEGEPVSRDGFRIVIEK